jgi:molecular chaperone HtpG
LRRSPHLEGFAAKGVEVLLLSDPVDEFWIPSVTEFEGRRFKSVTRGATELGKIGAAPDADAGDKTGKPAPAPGLDALVAFAKLTLKDQIKDVRLSERLTDSAVCLVADEGDMDMHLERLLKQHRQLDQTAKRVLEINPGHPMIRRLADRLAEGGDATVAGGPVEEAARLLLDQARILEGEALPDPAAFGRRLALLVERGLAPG